VIDGSAGDDVSRCSFMVSRVLFGFTQVLLSDRRKRSQTGEPPAVGEAWWGIRGERPQDVDMDSFFLLRFPREKKPTGPGFSPAGTARFGAVFRRQETLCSIYVLVTYMKFYEMQRDTPDA